MTLVIFDMDRLMFDTGRLAYRAYYKTAQKFDIELNPAVYYHLTGRNERGIREELKKLYGENLPTDTWRDFMNQEKNRILLKEQRVYKKKGLLKLLAYLKKENYLIGLASSTKRETILWYLELEKMPAVFDVIVAGDEVLKGKPDPEIFLIACEKLGVTPESAIVIEDSFSGIGAAFHAGIPAFLVEDDLTDLPNFEGKHKIQQTLTARQKQSDYPMKKFDSLLDIMAYFKDRQKL
ncbi:hypothetical protein IGI37_003379 [Enterococcus sp. AZ194]|uniref:HAD family hydrolase n=1 Tax=Enterococcus sp. AZ194 TaxID=2774629 RepID=UPI003F29831E